jgi:integrase/recombinase XerD
MASVKLILRPQENADETHSLNIQVVKDRKTSLVFTGFRVKKKDWDPVNRVVKRSHPNSAKMNIDLRKLLDETADKVIEMKTSKKQVSARSIKKAMTSDKDGTFFKQAAIYLEQLEKRGIGNLRTSQG